MHPYRTHTCGEIRPEHVEQTVRLSGWIHSKRDHGQLLFIDLRDHYGVTQCVVDVSSPLFEGLEAMRVESVLTVTGPRRRPQRRDRQPEAPDRPGRTADRYLRGPVAARDPAATGQFR